MKFLIKKRWLVLMLLIGVAACTPCSQAVSQSEQPLVIGIETPLLKLDPMSNAITTSIGTLRNIYDGFFSRNADGALTPGLVESWKRTDDYTWRFELRRGVKYHNGNTFSAEDVKFTLERTGTFERSQYQEVGREIDNISIVDSHTVDITTKSPNPIFPTSIYSLGVMDKEWAEEHSEEYVASHAMGTGPYEFVKWEPEEQLVLKANENYWGGEPSVKEVVFKPITESSTRVSALETGEVDFITAVPINSIERVEDNSKIDMVAVPGDRIIFLGLNHREGFPTSNLNVRKAMYSAINVQEISDQIFDGFAAPASQLVAGEGYVGFDPDLQRVMPYDPEAAKELLEKAGYPDGFNITLDAPFDRYPKDEQVAVAVTAYLRKVGIKCTLNTKPKSVHFGDILEGETDFWLIGWREASFDISEAFKLHVYSYNSELGTGAWNAGKYSNKTFDNLLREASEALSLDKREELLKKANRIAMEDIAVIPLYKQPDLYAHKKGIYFTPRADMFILASEITFK